LKRGRRLLTAELGARSPTDDEWARSPQRDSGSNGSGRAGEGAGADNANPCERDVLRRDERAGKSRVKQEAFPSKVPHPYGILERAIRSFRSVDDKLAQPSGYGEPVLGADATEWRRAAADLAAGLENEADDGNNDTLRNGMYISLPSTMPKRVFPWDTTTGAIGLSHLERKIAFLRRRQRLLQQAYKECGRITSVFAKTFYLGTLFLPKWKRNAIWAVYVWCRRTDDLVDGPRVRQRDESLRQTLADWERRLERVWAGYAQDALELALFDTVRKFPSLRMDPFRDMIQGMLMDVDRARYETFDELYLYCYRVAGTVGLMALPILGIDPERCSSEAEAVEPALALGIALQLTNILRDVGEDALRGRIYLPLEEIHHFGYSEEELFAGIVNDKYQELIKFQIARVRAYYRTAEHGIAKLHPDARLPIRASLDMYRQILDAIEENDFDNFHRRAYVSKLRKALTLPVSWLRVQDTEGTWLGRLWGPFDRGFIQRPNE
jgi:phytoene synthase